MKPLARLVADIATPICNRAGFAKASIVLDWDKIISSDFRQFCQVIKVTFSVGQKSQGVLHIRTTSAMALAISYQEPQILDCVNRYYGYQAIAKVKIHQGPLVARSMPSPKRPDVELDSQQQMALSAIVETLPPGELRDALQSLGTSVYKHSGDNSQEALIHEGRWIATAPSGASQ